MTEPRTIAPLVPTIDDALHDIFGFADFREGQREVVEAVVAGQDSLVVMPTGSGKSLCFQLPACVIEGITLVVSPLIALMKDQLDAMLGFGVPTTLINSSIGFDEQRTRLNEIVAGRYKVVYVAPERFRNQAFLDAIARVKVGLLAIDEAHCISQWGHDFRPDYRALGEVREVLGEPVTLALTATATTQVQEDILRQLHLPDAQVVVSGFARPNLFFEVFHARRREDKRQRIRQLLGHYDGESAVIYCATRKQVEEVATDLAQNGIDVGVYHAGLSDHEREHVQDAFMAGDRPVLVATNAFGMGVDKPDVRAIVHYNIPGSIEAYYQEAGRAGRDGEPAHCLMLYNYADRGIHDFFIDNSFPSGDTIRRVWEALTKFGLGTHALSADQLAQHLSRGASNRRNNPDRVHPMAVEAALRQLRYAGHIDFGYRDGYPWLTLIDMPRLKDLRVDWDSLDRRRETEESHLLDVLAYASCQTCRQRYLLRYFNSKTGLDTGCGHCDICSGRPEYSKRSGAATAPSRIVCPEPVELVVKKLLSGVARSRGKWGAHAVAGMLRGSTSKKIKQAGLDRLSTFGILNYLRQQDIVDLLDLCGRSRLTTQNVHGCISLTDEGVEVMTDQRPLPDPLARNLDAMLDVRLPGSTPTAAGSSAPAAASRGTGSPGGTQDTYLLTLELAQQGLDYTAIAHQRGLTPSSVLRHFMVLANEGYELDLSAHLDGQLLPMLRELAGDWNLGDPLAPLKERIPVACSYDQLKIHLAQLLLEREQR